MTEDEAREFLRSHGWTFQMRKPCAGVWIVYAQRVSDGHRVPICPLAYLNQQTEASLLAILENEEG